nr:DNA polymerase III subunit gamma and tau [Nanchangia anserum]
MYRRYRPDTFAQVIGQEHVTQPLMAALRGGRINHAYLFSGPRGCGKTTSARIMARCLNCAEGPTDVPCGTCDSCRELATGGGGALDVVEIDAASHNGVDDARELRERAAFAPVRDRYKIFILDEAHMVTSAGFNALLKIVEEPPEHVLFIFATTEPEKVIGTIRSRTHHYPFRLVPPETMGEYLEHLCAEEDVRLDGGVAPLIVRAGGGSVRDSLSILDQLIAGSEDRVVEYQRAVALLGYTDQAILARAVDAIADADAPELFGLIEESISSGHDPRRLVEDLLQRLRDLVVIALAGEDARAVFAAVSEDEFAQMHAQAQSIGPRALTHAADLANQALTAMVGATSPRLHLEILAAKLLLPIAPAVAASPHAADSREDEGTPKASSGADVRDYLAQRRAARAANQQSAAQPPSPAGAGPVRWENTTDQSATATDQSAENGSLSEGEATVEAHVDDGTRRDLDGPDGGSGHVQRPEKAGSSAQKDETAPDDTVPAREHDDARGATASSEGRDEEAAAAHGAQQPVGEPEGKPAVSLDVPPARDDEAARNAREPELPPQHPTSRSSEQTPGKRESVETPRVAHPDAQWAQLSDQVTQRWNEVLSALERISKVTWMRVKSTAEIGAVSEETLTLVFQSEGSAQQFSQGPHPGRVADAVNNVLGVKLEVRGVTGNGGENIPTPRRSDSPVNAPVVADRSLSQTPSGPSQRAQDTGWPEPATPPVPAPSDRTTSASGGTWPETAAIPQSAAIAELKNSDESQPAAYNDPHPAESGQAAGDAETLVARGGLYAVATPEDDGEDQWILDEAEVSQHDQREASDDEVDLDDTVPLEEEPTDHMSGVAVLSEVLGGTVVDEIPLNDSSSQSAH